MSFENVYNTVRTTIGDYFTDRNEMNDPYNPESGKEDDLDGAWGIIILGEDTKEELAHLALTKKVYSREFSLILSNRYVNSRGVPTSRVQKEIKLISDGKALATYLGKQFETCSLINSISFNSDNGIEFLFNDRYITTTFNFTITYQE